MSSVKSDLQIQGDVRDELMWGPADAVRLDSAVLSDRIQISVEDGWVTLRSNQSAGERRR